MSEEKIDRCRDEIWYLRQGKRQSQANSQAQFSSRQIHAMFSPRDITQPKQNLESLLYRVTRWQQQMYTSAKYTIEPWHN